MALEPDVYHRLDPEDAEGTVWAGLAGLQGGGPQRHPFILENPTAGQSTQLAAQEVRRIEYKGSGRILLYNIDLPVGVTMDLILDGASRRFSHGNETGVLRWAYEDTPFVFETSVEVIITNTTGAGQTFRAHLSGA